MFASSPLVPNGQASAKTFSRSWSWHGDDEKLSLQRYWPTPFHHKHLIGCKFSYKMICRYMMIYDISRFQPTNHLQPTTRGISWLDAISIVNHANHRCAHTVSDMIMWYESTILTYYYIMSNHITIIINSLVKYILPYYSHIFLLQTSNRP